MAGLADDDVEEDAKRVWVRRGGFAVLALVVVAGIVLMARELGSPTKPQQKQMAKIRIVPDTPPPPPPREEKRPEPPKDVKDVKEVRVEQPKEPPPAPSEQMKMEGEGSDKGLAGIVAGTVSKDYVGQAPAGGNRFAWYGDLLLQEVRQLLAKNPKLRVGEYRVVVHVWLTPEGRVSRTELAGSSGNGDIDALLRASLAELPPLRERPPDGLPWPIKLRVTSRL